MATKSLAEKDAGKCQITSEMAQSFLQSLDGKTMENIVISLMTQIAKSSSPEEEFVEVPEPSDFDEFEMVSKEETPIGRIQRRLAEISTSIEELSQSVKKQTEELSRCAHVMASHTQQISQMGGQVGNLGGIILSQTKELSKNAQVLTEHTAEFSKQKDQFAELERKVKRYFNNY